MKRLLILLSALFLLAGCSRETPAQIAATTLPVYEFTSRLVSGTPLTVTRLVTEEVSCLHDYSLNVRQVKAAEAAQVIVISGAGLEEFMHDMIDGRQVIDASAGIALLCPEDAHDHHEEDGHHHAQDPHIWLDVSNAIRMAQTICQDLMELYPDYQDQISANLNGLLEDLEALNQYGQSCLSSLSCRELITFHDGFGYLADGYGLTILRAVEEESGSEASARELIELIHMVQDHRLPGIFTEKSGSISAAGIITRETGCQSYALDMAMSGKSYFDAMYHNFDTLKEALG